MDEGPIDIKDCHDEPEDETICKICLGNEPTKDNPLLAPCKCTGSVKFIHYECLKFWLSKKQHTNEKKNVISYFWKAFECELCKSIYPCNQYITS